MCCSTVGIVYIPEQGDVIMNTIGKTHIRADVYAAYLYRLHKLGVRLEPKLNQFMLDHLDAPQLVELVDHI